MKQYLDTYKNELLDQVIPFWQDHSLDKRYGGYFTCLDQKGQVYDTDKFVWLQARQVWLFSMLCKKVDLKPDWLNMARKGAHFLKNNGRDVAGNFYFSLNQAGEPLVQPYNIFSDCFAAMAFSALYKVDPQEEFARLAVNTFENILSRRSNPKGKYNKAFPGTRNLKSFALPMILSNLTLEMESLLGKDLVKELVPGVIHEVMEVFLDSNSGLVLENVLEDGSFCDSFEGRLTSPGHAIEAMWFMLDLSHRFGDHILRDRAIETGLRTLEYGWDSEYGGIYYFMDCKGHPPDKLEWNQKLWWVHLECLVFLAKAFQMTGDPVCMSWFEKVHEYTWTHFKDPDYPEWFGYLDRYGKVQLPLKGGKWKGCFHVPRGLFQVWQTLGQL
ncbi:AGE family epimerase/isomerase [Cyclobacterium jeungdonense]|uniref:AGE family epimerase/isomerase n=1 Tax=Cyclobacterium jeungdonense TaxID=708087 RepID=A0ABT8C958_9BACT|nr:AGE family epimerase/isomerase [Cyclobacterium jeungdonense]MDN3688617.1 AGE family epimerase/isomerase [Cyclobacterium jeungdonense]